jgi:hypothetical protein
MKISSNLSKNEFRVFLQTGWGNNHKSIPGTSIGKKEGMSVSVPYGDKV